MGLLTNLLNPKVALMFSALIPHFVTPDAGTTFLQFFQLGMAQITVSLLGDALIICVAASMSRFFIQRPAAMKAQRWITGGVLGCFAANMLIRK